MAKLSREWAKYIGNILVESWSTTGEWPATGLLRIWLQDRWQPIESYGSLKRVFPNLSRICSLAGLAELTRTLCSINCIHYLDSDTPLQLQRFLGVRFQLPLITDERLEFSLNSRVDRTIYRWSFTRDGGGTEVQVGLGWDDIATLVEDIRLWEAEKQNGNQ